MATQIPESHQDLLTGPVFVSLVTMMPDGQPQATPVWCTYDGETILVNSAPGRQKDKNIRANPRVTVLAINPENPYSYLEVRGKVTEIIEDDEPMIDRLAKLYTGKDIYYGEVAPEDSREPRVTYRITPQRVIAN
jgi:PPOX class probable F420-dependent enzyme